MYETDDDCTKRKLNWKSEWNTGHKWEDNIKIDPKEDQIKENNIFMAFSMRRYTRNAHKYFVRKGEGKKLFGRPKHRRKDNIKINSKEIGEMQKIVFIKV
jgi:hypothetical protein